MPIQGSNIPVYPEQKAARLGKGLSALFGDAAAPGATGMSGEKSRLLPIDHITPNPRQPRRHFDKPALDELAASIKEKGLLQPLLVRPHGKRPNTYEIVAGERRWRAAQKAGLHDVPAIVRDITDREALECALIENVQRENLNPLEEAETYQRLIADLGHTAETVGKALGKSRAHIANMLRLNAMPEALKKLVQDGRLTPGHARALLGSKTPEILARDVIARELSVRGTEELVRATQERKSARPGRGARKGAAPSGAASAKKDADVLKLERDMSGWLGLKVTITPQGKGGSLSIDYDTLDQLEDVLGRLSQPVKK